MSEAAKKHLRVSPLIFKYVLREFMIPLACALAAFAFLFLVNNVFDDLPDFMSKNPTFPASSACHPFCTYTVPPPPSTDST